MNARRREGDRSGRLGAPASEAITLICGALKRTLRVAALVLATTTAATAEDIDLFSRPVSQVPGARPNVLIVLDNSSNWTAANQQWPGGLKQGQAELRALRKLLNEVKDNVNLGLMMFTGGSGSNYDGAYVRFAVRQMTAANKAALIEMIGDENCVPGTNSLTGAPNCIYRNYDDASEKVAAAQTDYSAALFEAFKYFGGYTNPANAQTGIAGSPVSASQFGPLRYSGNPDPKADPAAYVNGTADAMKREYKTILDAESTCASNTIIFIGNGFPSKDSLSTLLSNVGGSTAQLLMPTPGGGYIQPVSGEIRYADEWAKYLYTTDVSAAAGQQNVAMYTLDAYNAQPDVRQNRLLMSMAKHGGGRYFAVKDEDAILTALRDILIEIQSVSSVFTSTTIPINATNRAQYENQVYIGMFRPDGDSRPRWYGNLKRYQVGIVNGEYKLIDRNNLEALSAASGYLQACAASYWTTDSGSYWDFSPSAAGMCSTSQYAFSDLPDGPGVEKGAVAEVIRRGNDPSSLPLSNVLNRNMYTCSSPASCSLMVAFNMANVSQSALGAANATEQQRIVDHTLGLDVNDENANGVTNETRPSLHGDVIHSQPLPVSYGGTTGVVLFYGAGDGTFRAISGNTGKELWAFIAPEHHSKLKRLADNSPVVDVPGMTPGITPTPLKKDYFFDGSAGLYQNGDNSKVWIYPTMRRGGRMIYAFDVTNPASPQLKWRAGCPQIGNDTGCSSGMDGIGQTWSTPRVGRVKGYASGSAPILVVGGGYDACEDADVSIPSCDGTNVKGKRVYVIDAADGTVLATFTTNRSVAADVALVDRNADGYVDHAYIADTGGSLYRLDFADPLSLSPLASGGWTLTPIARTQDGGRKFLFAPSVLALRDRVFLAIGSGDRERPLQTQYPYGESVQNRFYMYVDKFVTGAPVNLDGSSMTNFTADAGCTATFGTGQNGWFMDLTAGRGEQTVTGSLIFGGVVYFSTNRPVPSTPGMCTANLGEARGYAVNLMNASGAVGTQGICGAARSNIFTGGGLPPTPVTATLPVNGKPVTVVFGGISRSGGASSSIGAQRVNPSLSGRRSRMYWYTGGNK